MKTFFATMMVLFMLSFSCVYGCGSKPDITPPTPVTPPPVVTPVTPPVTPPTVTERVEYGEYKITGSEVDFYFKKPIAEYGTFNLFIGGKKIATIKGNYLKGNIEVRNSNSTGKLVVITDLVYKGKTSHIIYSDSGAPPPTPEPEPEPTPVNTTTENGQYRITGSEVDFYYSKPIATYGTFTLYIADKKIAEIKSNYKVGNVEVRNSNSTGKMVVITDTTYKNKTSYIKYNSDASVEPTPPPTPPSDEAEESRRFAHANHMSWKGQGTTIVFCAGDDVTSVTFHDTPFHFHMKDGLDKGPGREQWTNHYFQGKSETGTAGWFVWVIGGKKYKYYSDGRGDGLSDYVKHTGDCYQKYN